jgi:hypothetical protein
MSNNNNSEKATVVIGSVKTSLEAEQLVDGPRDGKGDPEQAHLEALVLPADPSLEIPMSSFAKELSRRSTTEVANPNPKRNQPPPEETAKPQVHQQHQQQQLQQLQQLQQQKKQELIVTSVAGTSGWKEVKVADGASSSATTIAEALEAIGGQQEPQSQHRHERGGERIIEKPMEGMLIADFGIRERAWRGLAKRLYDQQPPFLDRGKQRWNGLVEYDHNTDTVMWNRKSLPNSRLFKSTFDHAKGKTRLGQTVLVLMEKNESKIIERMLQSIIDDIDGFIILDTGSTDNTEQVMWDFLVTKHKKQGAIYRTEWYDFGTNRTITAQLAHQMGDWLMLMDADYRLERENKAMPQAWKSLLPSLQNNPPAWLLLKTTGDLDYARPHVVLGSVRWCYVCRTHEYLSKSVHDKSNASFRQETFPALMIDHVGDGQSKADKMGRDIVLLLMDMMDDTKGERAPFYLANTLKQIRMFHWSIRSYKTAMNRCQWNEEIYCSAKGMLECMFQLPHGEISFERMLAVALHGQTQNPERLELLAMFVRKIRNTKEWWPKYSHLASSLLALQTHATYPSHQKLFIERPEHDFGIWQEASICAFYNPAYFEFGLHMSHKLLELPSFKQQGNQVQQQNIRNKALYEAKLSEWKKRGVRVTDPIRKYLLEQGHKAMAQGKFAKAKDCYQHVLHNVVLADIVPEHLFEGTQTAEERKVVADLCDHMSTQMFHKFHRLTAWQNCKCVSAMTTAIDQDRALASYQMGQCQLKLDNENRLLAAMYYVDALKWVPGFPPAIASLYELTILKSSDLTRSILYLLRLVSMNPMVNASLPLMRTLKANMESLVVDQSEWCHVTRIPHLPATPWLLPIAPRSKDQPTASTAVRPQWSNIIQSMFVCCTA